MNSNCWPFQWLELASSPPSVYWPGPPPPTQRPGTDSISQWISQGAPAQRTGLAHTGLECCCPLEENHFTCVQCMSIVYFTKFNTVSMCTFWHYWMQAWIWKSTKNSYFSRFIILLTWNKFMHNKLEYSQEKNYHSNET